MSLPKVFVSFCILHSDFCIFFYPSELTTTGKSILTLITRCGSA
jgi:hypothetical protein